MGCVFVPMNVKVVILGVKQQHCCIVGPILCTMTFVQGFSCPPGVAAICCPYVHTHYEHHVQR